MIMTMIIITYYYYLLLFLQYQTVIVISKGVGVSPYGERSGSGPRLANLSLDRVDLGFERAGVGGTRTWTS